MLYRNLSGVCRKHNKSSVRIASLMTDVRSRDLPNMKQRLYSRDRTVGHWADVTGHSDAVSKWPDIPTRYPSDWIFWRCIQVTGYSDAVSKWPDILTVYPLDRILCHCRSDILTLPTSPKGLILHPHDQIFWPLTMWPDILPFLVAIDRMRPR